MKRGVKLGIGVFVVLLVLGGVGLSLENPPKGFRGLKWGDPPGEDMYLLQEVNQWLSFYTMRDEELVLDDVKLYMVIYSFYTASDTDKKFMNVSVYFEGERAYKALRTICEERFGRADQSGGGTVHWRDWRGLVEINYGGLTKKGMLTLGDHKIWTEYLKQRAKSKSEEAQGDW